MLQLLLVYYVVKYSEFNLGYELKYLIERFFEIIIFICFLIYRVDVVFIRVEISL